MHDALQRLDAALEQLPLIAILRGLAPEQAIEVVQALFDEGIRIAEVPLNSPRPFETLRLLVERFGERMVIGAGTVLTVAQLRELAATGAALCVSPNVDAAVIGEALALGLVPLPGYQTPTEAFAALRAGARHLKLFPAAGRAEDIAALRAVLPKRTRLIAVGGATPASAAAMRAAGADGFGVGSDLYRPGDAAARVRQRAQAWIEALRRVPIVECVWNPQAMIGEGPVWLADEDAVAWVDPVRRRLLRFAPARGGVETEWDAAVSALVRRPADGRLLGCVEDGLAIVEGGQPRRAATQRLDPGCRFNDMTIDARGGLWIGAMHKGLLAGRGALYHAAGVEGPLRRVADGLGVPNGMAFDADQRTLYLIDTLSRHLLAYPADTATGSLGEPVIVTDFLGQPGKPDGMCIAPDGAIWVAMWGGGCVLRIGANGAVEARIELPAPHVSSLCCGSDGELWVTTSRMRLSAEQLATAPASGALFRIRGARGP